jgi:hypothetical protein
MYYLFKMDHNGMAALTRSECEEFWEVLYTQCSGWDWWWYTMEWQGMLGMSVRGTD